MRQEQATEPRRPLVLRWRMALLNSFEPASVKLTLLALAEHANLDGTHCFPSAETLAMCTSQHEKTCRRALDAAEGRWFTRTQIKLRGREWRSYSYTLSIPEGANTSPPIRREGADTVSVAEAKVPDTVSAPQGASSGHCVPEVRTLSPQGPGTVSDDLGKAPRKSTKEEAPAADAAPSRKRSAKQMTFVQWSESLPAGEKGVPESDPIFDYAEKIDLPYDFLALHWRVFMAKYCDSPKRYADWRAVFRNSVRGNWFKLWFIDGSNQYLLTTQGRQAEREFEI